MDEFMTIKSFFDRLMFENHTLYLKKEYLFAILEYVKVYLINITHIREREQFMAVSYKKLWHLLLDRDMMKKDLEEQAEISHYAMNKLSHDEDVSTEVLGKICKTLGCAIDDIMEFTEKES